MLQCPAPIPLPIPLRDVKSRILDLALQGRFRSPAADALMLAIGLHESGFKTRRQYGNGPAKGLWQFERGGGCAAVLTHPASRSYMEHACAEHGIDATPAGLWNALEFDDLLAAKAARMLLWTDPQPIPTTADAAWAYYVRNWRPGKPRPQTWASNYAKALQA